MTSIFRAARLAFLIVAAAPAVAQDLPSTGPYPADVIDLPHREAIEAVLRLEYPQDAAMTVSWWAGFSGDPSLRPLLRDVVETYRQEYTSVSAAALASLAMLGEPPTYFLDLAATLRPLLGEGDYHTAEDAANALLVFADPALADSARARPLAPDINGETALLSWTGDEIEHYTLGASEVERRERQTLRGEVQGLVGNLSAGYSVTGQL